LVDGFFSGVIFLVVWRNGGEDFQNPEKRISDSERTQNLPQKRIQIVEPTACLRMIFLLAWHLSKVKGVGTAIFSPQIIGCQLFALKICQFNREPLCGFQKFPMQKLSIL